jgi:molybdate transport system substrate-binding protein
VVLWQGRLCKELNLTSIFLANKQWAEYIDSAGFFSPESKVTIARNQLVAVSAEKKNISQLASESDYILWLLNNANRIAIGNPAHVPAGIYAKESFENLEIYQQIASKLITTKDVRSALMLVELKEADLGVVYRTDAARSDKVYIVAQLADSLHKPIEYVGGICNKTENSAMFYHYIQSVKVKDIWQKHGFR